MLKKNFIMAITAIFALVACSEKFDEPGIPPAGSDNVHTLSVGIEAGTYTPAEGGTKASMEAVIRINWTKDDEVSVVNATKGKILGGSLKAKESGTSVTFEGTVTGGITNGDRLYYIYPKLDNTEEIAFADTGYDQKLSDQKYDATKPNEVCFYGYAEDVAGTVTISKKIQFNLVTAYAHLNMSNLPAKGAPLTGIDISNVNEGFTWKLSSEKTLSAEPYVGNNGISVTCTNNNITPAGNAVVRFALPASAASQQAREITVNKAYKNDGYTVKELEKASYHNQLYSTWENNVNITSESGKTKVTITTSEGSTEVAEGVIPVAEAFNDTKPTEIGIGGVGTVTFDATATAKIKSNADAEGSTNVFFKVKDVTNDTDVQNKNIVYEVTMKTVDEKGIEVFAEGKADGVATVTVSLGEEVVSVESVSLVDENGQKISGGVVGNSWHFDNGILTFHVNHFSKYAIQYTVNSGEVTYVAQIGGRKYTTLANAIAAAQNGNTIQMIADFTAPAKIEIGADKNIVLDLNGHTISYSTSEFEAFITNKGSLRITDSSNGKNGKITATHSNLDYNHGCYTIDNFGGDQSADKVSKLVIDAGTIENASTNPGLAWPVNNGSWNSNAELIINGGTIHSVNYVPVREYLQYGGKKTIVINGGKFISNNSRAIAVQVNEASIQDTGSSVTINGGEFTCNGSGILYIDLHAANVNMTGFTMTVNGGQFKNSNADAPVLVYDYEGNTQTSAVLLSNILKGGIYSKEPAPELIPFGYHIEENTDAQTSSAYPWRVAANPATNAEVSVSKPGQTTVYSTLAAFRDETNAGNTFAGYTVTLLKDIDLTNDDWTPIGTTDYYYYFSGVFDGNNHLITLNKSEIPGDFGFFNLLVGDSEDTPAIVENLNLKVNLSSKQSTRTWIGGVTDMAYGYVLFENIVVTGSITSGGYAGGIVGYSSQNDSDWGSKVIYKNCTNKANINIVGKGDYTCLGGIAAQTGSNLDCFINCKNEGILTSDHTNISTAASYMGHMVGKGTYGKNISFSGCSFSESATINGWNVYNSEVSSYPFEGYMTPSQTYTYGTGTPNLGKQMVGGYFGTCTLDGVQQNFTYPNGSSD